MEAGKNYQLNNYLSSNETAVSSNMKKLNLDTEQHKLMKTIIDDILMDTYYTFLLGLDGSANMVAFNSLTRL